MPPVRRKPKPLEKLSANQRHQVLQEMRIAARFYKDLPMGMQNHGKFSNLVVNGDRVKLASWVTDYHNGDIDDYKERDPEPGELLSHISLLEEAWQEEMWNRHIAQYKSDVLVSAYTAMGIKREPTFP